MTEKEFKQEKAKAIAELCVNFIAKLSNVMENMPKDQWYPHFMFESDFFKWTLARIISQPMPKFPKGSPISACGPYSLTIKENCDVNPPRVESMELRKDMETGEIYGVDNLGQKYTVTGFDGNFGKKLDPKETTYPVEIKFSDENTIQTDDAKPS